jgi:hypothetical protein
MENGFRVLYMEIKNQKVIEDMDGKQNSSGIMFWI